jgi:uncharacterized protein YggE
MQSGGNDMMKHKTLTAGVVTLALAVAAISAGRTANAQSGPPAGAPTSPAPRTVTVIGSGRATAAPDIARVTLGADVVNKTLSGAVNDANQRMAAIGKALKDVGVEDRDIRTAEYNVFPQQAFGPNGPGPITGYRVVNLVRVTIRDLDKSGDVLEQAVEAGANNVQGLAFTIDDPRKVESAARSDAMSDARFKAETLATDAGAALGQVLTISEIIGGGAPVPMMMAQSAEGLGGGGVAVSPGMQDVGVQVQVTYELQ